VTFATDGQLIAVNERNLLFFEHDGDAPVRTTPLRRTQGRKPLQLGHKAGLIELCLHPDGKEIAIADEDTVYVFALADGSQTRRPFGPKQRIALGGTYSEYGRATWPGQRRTDCWLEMRACTCPIAKTALSPRPSSCAAFSRWTRWWRR
jgi:hypothetical protein